MADDYDDNVLLDSDDEATKSKKSKVSAFIPKPRILTSPASTLVAIAHSQHTSPTEHVVRHKHDSLNSDSNISRGSSPIRASDESSDVTDSGLSVPKSESRTSTLSNSSKNKAALGRVEDDAVTNGAAPPLETSIVHLVEHQPVKPPEESTYRRLISESPSQDYHTDSEEAEILKNQTSCLCRICRHPTIRKNWKVYLGSIILTLLGLGLITTGLTIGIPVDFKTDFIAIVLLVGGVIVLLPGGYHFLFLSLAAYDIRGFKFSKLPTIRWSV